MTLIYLLSLLELVELVKPLLLCNWIVESGGTVETYLMYPFSHMDNTPDLHL